MLEQLPHFIWLGLVATTLDVDNALYMTSQTQGRSEEEQKRLIFWGLIAEYAARFALVLVAFYIATGQEPLFTLAGFAVTPKALALLGAGIFLLTSSLGDLNDFFSSKGAGEKRQKTETKTSFTQLLVQMTVVNTVLSIDTVIAVTGMTTQLVGAAIILAVSAIIRFLFVRQIAGFIARHQETKIVILSFLMLIGAQLILQAFHDDLPESLFNLVLAGALVVALGYRDYHAQPRNGVATVKAAPTAETGAKRSG